MSRCGQMIRRINAIERRAQIAITRRCRIQALDRYSGNRILRLLCWIINEIYAAVCKLILDLLFWPITHILRAILFLPCRFQRPALDPRIKHIVVLMLENRSFDHMLGATPISGRDAQTMRPTETLRRPDGSANDVRDASGTITHHCVVGVGQKRSVGTDPGHEFGNTLIMLCGDPPTPAVPPGPPVANSGFAQNFAPRQPDDPCTVMLSYRGDDDAESGADIPVLTALAREFAVCDHWFSSMPGPTWPNRLFIHAASSAGLDDSPAVVDSVLDELLQGFLFENGTLYNLLDSENISWSVYHGDALPQVMTLAGMDLPTIAEHFHRMDEFEDDLRTGHLANYVFIEPNYGDDLTSNTFKCGNSQHPLDDITHGERLIKQVYEALRNSPLWNQSMLIITYDEGGGFYDHLPPPPTVSPGDMVTDPVNNHHNFDFTQLGVRVPAVVCSPWIPRNLIDHRVYDHASVPATVERLWHLPPLTRRDAQANDLATLLTLPSPRTDTPTTLPEPAKPDIDCPGNLMLAELPEVESPVRPPAATLLDPATKARAQQEDPRAITSTSAAFFRLAVRRDLQLAPRPEHHAIMAQARRLQTMGEVSAYAHRVIKEIARG